MKFAISSILAITALMFSQSWATDWQPVFSMPNNKMVGYIDFDSIKHDGDTVEYWDKGIFPDGAGITALAYKNMEEFYGRKITSFLSLIKINCKDKTLTALRTSLFSGPESDFLLESVINPRPTAELIVPGTFADYQYMAVCK